MKNIIKKILNLKNKIHKGDKVECLICDFKANNFNNGRCYNCDSLPRIRLIPFSIKYFKLENIENLLHIAPNIQEFNFIEKKYNFEVYDRLNLNPSNHINLIQDLTKTTLPNDRYDLIIIWHVLEHIINDSDAINEMYRVLKIGGKLLVSVPIFPKGNTTTYEPKELDRSQFNTVHGHPDHCRSCGLDYFLRFEEVGFTTQTLHTKDIDIEVKNKLGLSDSHTVWLFTK
jgi:predicted SAM-dependent methyltransferase